MTTTGRIVMLARILETTDRRGTLAQLEGLPEMAERERRRARFLRRRLAQAIERAGADRRLAGEG